MSNLNESTTEGNVFLKAVYKYLKQEYVKNNKVLEYGLNVCDDFINFMVSETVIIEYEPNGKAKNSVHNKLGYYATHGSHKNRNYQCYWEYNRSTSKLKVTQLYRDYEKNSVKSAFCVYRSLLRSESRLTYPLHFFKLRSAFETV